MTGAITLQSLIENLISAASLGSLYAMFALGLALVFGVMGLVNFAHGEFIMAGGYALVVLAGAPLPLLIVGTLACAVFLAVATERVAFRPLRGANAPTLLVTSFAVSFLLQNLAMLIFGTVPKSTNVSSALTGDWMIGQIRIERLDLVTLATAMLLLGGLATFLRRTRVGLQMRASAENFTMARLLGVRANRVIAAAFMVSGVLAGAAAVLLVAQTGSVSPTMGVTPVLLAFVAVVIGGMGSLGGAVLGAYLLGALTVALQVALPLELRPYRDAFLYLCVFLILVFRPGGLISGALARTV